MSRVEYTDDEPYPNAFALFDANVQRAAKGRRGQALLKELEEALLRLPEKRLAKHLICVGSQVCALGALSVDRAVRSGKTRPEALQALESAANEMSQGAIDEESGTDKAVGFFVKELGIHSELLTYAIVFQNDEASWCVKSPEDLYRYMLGWVQERILR